MFFSFSLLIINLSMVLTIQIGRVYQARLVTTSNSTWIYRQTNINASIYTAVSLFNSNFFALNYFSLNRSCQIFNSPVASPEILSYSNATVILRQSLPSPCCSNLTWLLKRLRQAQQSSAGGIQRPTFLSINPVNQLLSVMSFNGGRSLLDRTSLNVIVNETSIGSNCSIVSQFESLFISSCNSPNQVRIYDETQSGLQLRYIIGTTDSPGQVVFLQNNTWLLVSIQHTSIIQVYSVNLATNTFRYNQSITVRSGIIWSLTRRNDTTIYICFWEQGTPVFSLSYNGRSWVFANLPVTQASGKEIPAQVGFDPCGRLWLSVYGFGIRIYDAAGQTLLASLSTVSTGIRTLLILQNFEIYFGNYVNNTVYRYDPNLECTA